MGRNAAMTEETAGGAAPPSGDGASDDGYLEFAGVSKRYESRRGSTLALEHIDLRIRREEFVVLLGQSGCGKTTLLRILGGLIAPTAGTLRIGGRSLWNGMRRDNEALAKLG